MSANGVTAHNKGPNKYDMMSNVVVVVVDGEQVGVLRSAHQHQKRRCAANTVIVCRSTTLRLIRRDRLWLQ